MSLQYPQRENLEFFLCIYLPGFLIAIAFLIVIHQEHWIDKLIIDYQKLEHPKVQVQDKKATLNKLNPDNVNNINSGLVLAIYALYFIAVPLIFGTLTDGLRHSCSRLCGNRFNIKFLKWRYPTRAGYMDWVNDQNEKSFNEAIYIRKIDKSDLLFHAYEFFGNIIFSIVFLFLAYMYYQSDPQIKDILIIFSLAVVSIALCLIFMYVFWKENEEHCKKWLLYREDDYQ